MLLEMVLTAMHLSDTKQHGVFKKKTHEVRKGK